MWAAPSSVEPRQVDVILGLAEADSIGEERSGRVRDGSAHEKRLMAFVYSKGLTNVLENGLGMDKVLDVGFKLRFAEQEFVDYHLHC